MLDIMKAIYDMMGKCTYPVLKEETPRQHVEVFFQASVSPPPAFTALLLSVTVKEAFRKPPLFVFPSFLLSNRRWIRIKTEW